MNDFLKFLFTFEGTVPRKQYLLAWAALVLIEIVLAHAILAAEVLLPQYSDPVKGQNAFTYLATAAFLATVPFYIAQTSFAVRRLRDMGRSVFWVLTGPVSSLLLVLTGGAFIYWILFMPETDGSPSAEVQGIFAGAMIVGGFILYIAPYINQFIYLLFAIPKGSSQTADAEDPPEQTAQPDTE